MKAKNQLLVAVQDHTYKRCNAKITIRGKNENKWHSLVFDKIQGCYSHIGFEPGEYELKIIGKKGWREDIRYINLKLGTNSIYSSIAPANTPFYSAADGEKVFFREEESKMLLYVSGNNAEKRTTEICKKNKIVIGKSLIQKNGENNGDWTKFYLELPKEKSKREAYLDGLQELIVHDFKEQGITARIARPIIKGENIIEGLTNELIVKFQNHVTIEGVRRLAKKYGFEIVRTVPYLGNTYVLRYSKYPDYSMIKNDMASGKGLPIVWAEPNRIQSIVTDAFVPNDFLYPEQTHYQVINAEDAWDTLDDIDVNIRAGNPNITIAVFDTGISPSHPDLTGNLTDGTAKMIANFDFQLFQNQTLANLGSRNHGTQSTSSATGRFNNNNGATGLAGNCHLIGGTIGFSLMDWADGFIWSAGFATGNPNPSFPPPVSRPADIISNSWGSDGAPLSNTIKDALDFLTTYGRNGRGCILCFSIGNLGYIDFTTDPMLRRMFAAYEKTIAVGASINVNPVSPVDSPHPDHNGNTTDLPAIVDTRAYYSPYGPSVDIVSSSSSVRGASTMLSAVRENAGDVPSNNTSSSTLQNAAGAGANTINVNSSAGFAVGEFITIRTPGAPNREFIEISGITGNTITLDDNLANAHGVGTIVSTGANNHSISFGGTSHACPTVAGAAALMLSIRPELNWVQLREILRNTAVKIDIAQTNTIGQWTDNDGDGEVDYSQWYGYGRLDVNAAVISARDKDDFSDIVMRDNLEDMGDVASTGWHAHSPDIWVQTDDGDIPVLAYNNEPPHQNAKSRQDNYVFLRVKNFGNGPSSEVYLRALITHYPGFEFRYPVEWQPSNRPGEAVPSPLTPGTYLIGEQRIDNLEEDDDTIVKMTWDQNLIPPESVLVAGVTVAWHPCILGEVSPHDGPNPDTTGHSVKDNNNLAHRNIRVDYVDEDADVNEDLAVGVVAGSSDKFAVEAIILDRSFLPDSYDIFIRVDNEKIMGRWIDLIKTKKISMAPVLPGTKAETDDNNTPNDSNESACGVILLDPSRLSIKCCDGNHIIIHAPQRTKIEMHCSSKKNGVPHMEVGSYQNKRVIIFKGGSKAIELPYHIPSTEFVPIVIGIKRPSGMRKQGYLKATQRKTNGELSPGYTIEG